MSERIELEDSERLALEVFGNIFHQMHRMICDLTDDELALLKRAAAKVTETNCWCCSYSAAQFLPREIDIEIYQRSLKVRTHGASNADQ